MNAVSLRRAVALAAALCAAPAWAQTAAQAEAEAPATTQSITITAQGRKQEAQKVPIALQVVTPEELGKLGAATLADANGYIPGLVVDAGQATQPSFALRGIGSGDFGIGTDAPVGIYVNGIYAGKSGGALMAFNDLRRIEVLKGPQGTLFGRNSAGGAIAIVPAEPTANPLVKGLLRLGDYGALHTETVLNQPLNEDWSLRIAAAKERREGFDHPALGDANEWGMRSSLRWSGREDTSVLLSWEHDRLTTHARPLWALSDGTQWFDPRRMAPQNDADPEGEGRRFDGLTLRVEHDLPFGTLTSLTGWRRMQSHNDTDNDGTADPLRYLSLGNAERNRTLQQEFRLSGKSAWADWLLGASWYTERAEQTATVRTNTAALDGVMAASIGLPPFATLTGLGQAAGLPDYSLMGLPWAEHMFNRGDYRATALYGDVIWHLSPATRLTTGLRLTHDSKRFSWYNPLRQAPGVDAGLAVFSPEFFAQMVAIGAMTPEEAAQTAALVAALQTSNVEFTNTDAAAAPLHTQRSWNDASPRLVLDHALDAHTLLWASLARGYQAGGFNALHTQGGTGAFSPETVLNLEGGIKGSVPGAGLSYAASVFSYRFKNLQDLMLDTSSAVPVYVVSVSDRKAWGLDVEAQWQLTPALRAFGSAEWLNQTYGHFVSPTTGADLSGQATGVPRLTANAGIEWRTPLAGGVATSTLQGAYTGATRCNTDAASTGACLSTPLWRTGGARSRLDARLAWDAADERWGVALLVNNLSNRRDVVGASSFAAVVGVPWVGGVTPPRTVAVELRAKL